mgnify:CR=1 FL=1|jgi:hypothetical protein|tara:strand:+ start:237 stop:473 length:237 start_codon:yes stop_codon:yes gene_type:complete
MDTKNLYDIDVPGFTVLTDNIVYDEIEKEIILKLGRLQISLELEEFVSVFLEMEAASNLIHKILLTKVQNIQDNKEIN